MNATDEATPAATATADEVLRRFELGVNRGDIDLVLSLFSKDVRLTTPGPNPVKREYFGLPGVREYLATAEGIWSGGTRYFKIIRTVGDGDVACAEYEVAAVDADGKEEVFRGVKLARVQDGLIVEFTQYYDTLAVHRAASKRHAAVVRSTED